MESNLTTAHIFFKWVGEKITPKKNALGSPNFELVADILDWLLHRFEPGIAIPDDISISASNVFF